MKRDYTPGSAIFAVLLILGAMILPGLGIKQAQAQAITNLGTVEGRGGFRLDGADPDDDAGVSVSGAGDVNGDGFGDVIVGAKNADPDGSSYVVFGGIAGISSLDLSAINGANGFRVDGATNDNRSGNGVSGAGDVNGDGFADVIISAYLADHNGINSGSAYVVYGSDSIFSVLSLASIVGSNGFRIDGALTLDECGYSVSGAGDVNGDGFSDVIVGAHRAEPNGTFSGASAVIFGSDSSPADLNFSDLNGVNGFRLNGALADDRSGYSVAGAGDVNGDGFADVIIGAPYANSPNGLESGSSYVVFGKADWSTSTTVELASLNGTNGFRLDGEDGFDHSAFTVNGAGDVNGDGYADIIIGAIAAIPNGNPGAGSSYIVFGKADWSTNAIIDLALLNGANGFRLDGVSTGDYSATVSGAGDVNRDGFADMIIGAKGANPNGVDSGTAYVVFGKASGWPLSFLLSALDGTNGYQLHGAAAYEYSGKSVSGAGDINGDGLDDIIIGAPATDSGLSKPGSAYVVFGANGQDATFHGRSRAGNARKTAVDINGDAALPDSRIWLDFDAGIAGFETVHVSRTRENLANLTPLDDVARTVWNVSTSRTGWNTAVVTLKYTNADITGITGGEGALHIYRGPTPTGPWTALPTDRFANKNQVSAITSQLSFFAISGIEPPATGVPDATWMNYR